MAVPHPADSFDPADNPGSENDVWAWLEGRYREHSRQLYRYAYSVLGNREDAEDATQIALLNAHRALARGERPSRPRAWLFAIALNVCRRLLQARARGGLPLTGKELAQPEDAADVPTRAEISLAVASLPSGQREIFLLRELQGLSYAELSDRLGLSAAATESLLARARRRLRDQLTVPGETPEPGRARRRAPLFGFPGHAVMRIVRGPATLKLAGVFGAAAIAPGVVIGLPADSARSPQPHVTAASSPAAATTPSVLAPAGLSRQAPTRQAGRARTAHPPTRSAPTRSAPAAARVARSARVRSAPAAKETAATAPGSAAAAPSQRPAAAPTTEAVGKRPAAATATQPRTAAVRRPPARPPAGTPNAPVASPNPVTVVLAPVGEVLEPVEEVLEPVGEVVEPVVEPVEEALETVQGVVDEVVSAVPVPAVSVPEVTVPEVPALPLDPVIEKVLPDPPPLIKKVGDVSSGLLGSGGRD